MERYIRERYLVRVYIYALHRLERGGYRYIMKKLLSLVMVGIMAVGMTAVAADSPSAEAVTTSQPAVSSEAATSPVEAAAASLGLTVAEYQNNAIVSTPGVANAEGVAVGMGAYINGVKTNYTLLLGRASAAVAADAKKAGAGTLINVVTFRNYPKGATVQTSIYCKSIKATDKVTVYQKSAEGWKKITSSVRANHVDVKLESDGAIAIFRQ